LSGLIMAVAGGSLIAAFLLFKLVLAAAWCATLYLVDRLAAEFAPGRRSLALAITGWLPLGVLQTVAEGHNDIFLVMPVLLWLALLIGRKASSPLALGASVLSKYATAPLFLADAIYALRQERLSFLQYCLRMVLPAVMFLGLMAIFYRSFAFFDGVRLIGTWQFMHPDDAFRAVASVLGDWIAPAGKILLVIFPAIAAWQCWQYWKTPSNEMLLRLVLAILCAVSFSAVSHLWPWYLVWTLPVAALIPQWRLSRFVIGMSVVMPFSFVVWWVPALEDLNNAAALAMYGAAALWALAPMQQAEGAARHLPANVRMLRFRGRAARIAADMSNAGQYDQAEETVTLKKSA
jgi:alpha-1,6-mannosyltransferase